MKSFLVSILILASNVIFACGFYPTGEDIRFSFFNPSIFNLYSYSDFYYSTYSFSVNEKPASETDRINSNENHWLQYCKNKVSIEAVREVLYGFNLKDITEKSNNEMLRHLYKTKNAEAIDYLKFAKKCEIYNEFDDNSWEHNVVKLRPERTKLINEAVLLSNKVSDKELRYRYTFLAIRSSYYNKDFATIIKLYDDVFKSPQKTSFLKYWSLYFRMFAEKDKALVNYYAAQIFVNAPDKRFMASFSFDTKVPLESVLRHARNNQEKANIYLLAGIKRTDQSLYYLKQVYKYNPKSDGLSFLLLREINKIEDWVFTPYYSLFSPSLTSYDESEKSSTATILKRVERDRMYAGEVLSFINTINFKKRDNPLLWKMSKAYLYFVTKDNKNCLNEISKLEQNFSKKDSLHSNQMEIIKAMALTANQQTGKAFVLDAVKPILLKNENDKKFVFAIGRELEYKGNFTDAALLYSKLTEVSNSRYDNEAFWKTSKNKKHYYADYFDDYFDYINMVYTPEQVEDIIENTKQNEKKSDEFSLWKYSLIKKEIPHLYDLIGTKYIRINKLYKALSYFDLDSDEDKRQSVIRTYDCLWEKESCGDGYSVKDPFFALAYTPEFVSQKNYLSINKYVFTKRLISYLERAKDPKEKNKDYYNFLIANCYYNMTFYGSLKVMRRYGFTNDFQDYPVIDNDEFYECNLAKKYYGFAFKNAKTQKFKALCLRMMGKCELNKLRHKYPEYDYETNETIENYDTFLWNKNKYYQDLKSNYADDYAMLSSGCENYAAYFQARR
ncbi:hypothetical protein ACFSJW_06310 [Flavobacterium artemisiae]|uniref:Uncharacterized protein n=1 Tax=Flavobacterium artemisiae TaxID=2126556 RepID=A0ABW4HCC6_9FLAO